MTRPPFRTFPLLVQTLAAAMLCPVAFAEPKTTPQKQAETGTGKKTPAPASSTGRAAAKKTADQKQAAVLAAVAAGKAASAAAGKKSAAPTPAKNVAQVPDTNVKKQTQGDKPVQKGEPPRTQQFALIADPAELLARVPASGPLGEEHLILHAIATDPVLERRRAAIASARADKRAIQDWENPELRLSYGSQDDNYYRRPYSERSIEQYTANETTTGSDTTTAVADGVPGQTITDINSGNTLTNRYRETVRTITPTKNGGETVVTDVYELRTQDGTGSRDRSTTDSAGGPPATTSDLLADNVTRELKSHNVETMTPTQRSNASDTFSATIRFKIPNHWEKKARIQRASAEILLAEGQYLAEEDRLVREVRERYENLSVLEGTLSSYQHVRETYSTFRKEMLDWQVPEFADEALRAGLNVHKAQMDIFKTESDIASTRAELAHFVGLHDPARIRSGSMTRRIVDPNSLDVDYLVDIAMLYRADAVESRGRLDIAKAHLAEAQAAKIPWASFLDAGWSREWSDDRYGRQDEWTVRLGINFPLWEWTGINKKSKEYKKAAAAWELQFEKQKDRVRSDIELAIRRLRAASGFLNLHDKEMRELRAEAAEELPKITMRKNTDLAKGARAKYDVEVQLHEIEIGRSKAYADYNQALMFLEDAIGVRIEKALSGKRLY